MQEQLPPIAGYERTPVASDAVDVADVVRTLRRQWRAVIAFLALGVVGAAAVVLFAPRRFDGTASVFAHPDAAGGTSIAGRISGVGDLLGSLGGLGLSGSLETELQVLRSRMLVGQVVDSLQLEFAVKDPARVAPSTFIAASSLPGRFAPRTYVFDRQPDGSYRTESNDSTYVLHPGQSSAIDVGVVTLQASGLPPHFKLKVYDREDAITRFVSRLAVSKAGGEIAKIRYRGDDSVTAAAAANSITKFYLDQRTSTDRSVNRKRVEYVTTQLDQTGVELARAESDLLREQERTQIFDPEIVGKVEWESSAQMRKTLTDLQVEDASIHQLLTQLDAGQVTSADLSAYPAFVHGSAVTPLVTQLSELEGQRIRLLERRTESDPDVRALDETMRNLRANIAGMARSYASSVSHQRAQFQTRVDSVEREMMALPAAAQRGGRLQRDIRRLTEIYTALQAQLVEARLGTIGEGGEIRQVDVAVPQRKPAFPTPFLTMGIGTAGGLLAGIIAALFLGWFGRWLRDPSEIERAVGISAHRLETDSPLLVSPRWAQSLLVVPLDDRSETATVAERIARTARQRFVNATVLDLTTPTSSNGKPGVDSAHVGTLIDELEQRNGMVVVQLPGLLNDTTMAALRDNRPVVLVAPPGPVDRTRLAYAVDTLRRMQVPCAGVVISTANGRRPARALTV